MKGYMLLRHQMLAAVAAGKVTLPTGESWRFLGVRVSTKPQMARACNWLWQVGLIVPRESGDEIDLSTEGETALAWWDAKRPLDKELIET